MMRVCAVRTCFRLESSLDRGHACAESDEHLFQNMIGSKTQIAIPHLDGNVPVAEVIRCTRERERCVALHMQELLVLGDDFNDAAIGRDEQVSVAQYVAAIEQEPYVLTAVEPCAQTAFLAQVEWQPQSDVGLDTLPALAPARDLDHQNRK
jgi:hypothetical protein